jgi:hypothetical protein
MNDLNALGMGLTYLAAVKISNFDRLTSTLLPKSLQLKHQPCY